MTATPTPSPAALLAAMEAAALAYQNALLAYLEGPQETYESVMSYERDYEKATDPAAVLQLCAALRASQEREAAAVEELDAYRVAAMYDLKMEGAVFSHWNRSQLDRARLMSEVAIKAEGDKP